MKNSIFVLTALLLIGCQSSRLGTGSWYPPNHRIIDGWLQKLAAHPASGDVVAVFDFDNTCIFRDVGEAVFRYQLEHLRFKLEPAELGTLFPNVVKIGDVPMARLKQDILDSYSKIWELLGEGKANQVPTVAAHEHATFRTLMWWFFETSYEELGAKFAFPFLGKVLAGHSIEEVKELTREALDEITREPLGSGEWSIAETKITYKTGLKPYPEMIDLMRGFQAPGVDVNCYIVSASTEWIVKAAASYLGFPVEAKRVYGIRVKLQGDTLTTEAPDDDYPVTYREGKVQVIRQLIGKQPILIAGDATTDFEMLEMPGVPLRLLIHRAKEGPISTLYDKPGVLLQGIDPESGQFRPHRTSSP